MNIYFSGIGGVGIGPLAEIAHDADYGVTGSDPIESLMTRELRKKGIKISIVQDGNYLKECHKQDHIDWFVYTSALPENHPELAAARELGIKTAKRDELLSQIIHDKNLKLIAVAGTHGKTTTTGMVIWTMQQMGIAVSYSIGTTVPFGPSGKYDPNSEYFVYECDEFDRNFLNFRPYLSLITSIDFDHPDTYSSDREYLSAFRDFAVQSQSVVAWSDQHAEIFDGLQNVQLLQQTEINNFHLVGEHNRRNASLVQAALKKLGNNDPMEEILNSFPGVNRRFEKLADNLYSDYGHHPVEIASTLQMARELVDHVVLVYQPHQNIRQHNIKDGYTNQFELAEQIYWLPTYLSREDPNLSILGPEELIRKITNKDAVNIAQFDDELWDNIQQARMQGKLVLAMGAGEIDNWIRERLATAS